MLRLNDTATPEDVLVTTPPPCVLMTTAPETVDTATSFELTAGATKTVVGDGWVVAVISEDSTDCICDEMEDETEAGSDVEVVDCAVVVALDCRFAI